MRWSSAWTALASRRSQSLFDNKIIVSHTSNIIPIRCYSDSISVNKDPTISGKPIVSKDAPNKSYIKTEGADVLKDLEQKTNCSFISPPHSTSRTSQLFEDQLMAITENYGKEQNEGTDGIVMQTSHSLNDYEHQPHQRNSKLNDYEDQPQRRDIDASGDRDTVVDEDSMTLAPIKKNFFLPDHRLLDRSEKDNLDYLRRHNITVIHHNNKSANSSLPPAIQNFSDYTFPASIDRHLQQFTTPTPIQAQGWSVALSGRDLVGVGQTGSGKTLAYLLPALIHMQQYLNTDLLRQREHCGKTPSVLILAPTRELVQQIMSVAMQYGPALGVRSVAMFGGVDKARQLNMLQRGVELVVATPGRLLDFSQSGALSLRKCSFLVLDEADRMLDMGFEKQIRAIIRRTRNSRQTLMWSATWPEEVQDFARSYLTDYIQMNVGSTELQANPDIEQTIYICDKSEKLQMLFDLLIKMREKSEKSRAIVFCQSKQQVDTITKALWSKKISAEAIHANKTQVNRNRALNGFRSGRYIVLVATDVAARGLDIPEVTCVVNFDYPNDAEDYVHRIGRTGRCGNKGIAHTFFTKADAARAETLIKVLRQAGQKVSAKLQKMADSVDAVKKSYDHNKDGKMRRLVERGSYGDYGSDRGWEIDRTWQNVRPGNSDRRWNNSNSNNDRSQKADG